MFEGHDPARQQREAQWRAVSAQFKFSVYMSIGIALAADGVARWVPLPTRLATAWEVDQRVLVYVSLLYALVIPVLLSRVSAVLREYKVPRREMADRLLFAVLAVATLPLIIALPILLLIMGPQSVGAAHSAYALFTNSLVGLALGGSFLAYGAALAGWMLFGGMMRMFSQQE